jgi:hypothetical protein
VEHTMSESRPAGRAQAASRKVAGCGIEHSGSARARASWGLSGWRGNFCREALDGLSLAQSSPCRARSGRKTPAARRNGWLVARADRKSSLLPRVRASWGLSASGCTRSGRRSRPRMGSFQYRIKSQLELHERVVKESELSKA